MGLKNYPVESAEITKNDSVAVNSFKFNANNQSMELLEILKSNGKTSAVDLWKMSIYKTDIDEFYAALKDHIELKKTIKEVDNEKGYLELA